MYTENTKFFSTIGILILLTLVEIKEIKEHPHHLELQVINCSNFYNQDDHKNSVVNG